MAVDTDKVTRRSLHLSSYEQILDEARRLANMPTRTIGNWSQGQIYQHLATAMDIAIDGAPFNPPWFVRLIGPFLKKRMITRPMPPGFKLPKNAAALLPPATATAAGLAALEKSAARMQQTAERKRNVVFGNMNRAEWDQLQFRHCELHLSFIEPV